MAVAITQELLDRATAYVEQPLAARRYDEGLTAITALYSEITGEPASKCRQCQYSNYLAVVQAYIRQATRELHPETMEDSKYTLAPGVQNETFVHEAYGKAVTAENLTDEDAEFFISKGFKDAFILKPGQEASTEAAAPTEVESKNALVPEADLKAEQEAHQATKVKAGKALKAEQEAHKATKKELTAVSSKLADTEKQLAEALAKIETLSLPAAAPVVDPATQA